MTGELVRMITQNEITNGYTLSDDPIVKTSKIVNGITVPLSYSDVRYGFDQAVFSSANGYSASFGVKDMVKYSMKRR